MRCKRFWDETSEILKMGWNAEVRQRRCWDEKFWDVTKQIWGNEKCWSAEMIQQKCWDEMKCWGKTKRCCDETKEMLRWEKGNAEMRNVGELQRKFQDKGGIEMIKGNARNEIKCCGKKKLMFRWEMLRWEMLRWEMTKCEKGGLKWEEKYWD